MSIIIELMSEMSRRLSTIGSEQSKALLRDAGQQWAYCNDAPDEIPAGGVEWCECVIDGHDLSGAVERFVPREEPAQAELFC